MRLTPKRRLASNPLSARSASITPSNGPIDDRQATSRGSSVTLSRCAFNGRARNPSNELAHRGTASIQARTPAEVTAIRARDDKGYAAASAGVERDAATVLPKSSTEGELGLHSLCTVAASPDARTRCYRLQTGWGPKLDKVSGHLGGEWKNVDGCGHGIAARARWWRKAR